MKATKYINLKVNNSIWVLNRVTNLIRKRNYNIDDLNLTFDDENKANILIWFCTKTIDINQIAAQLEKLYDVTFIEIIDDLQRIKRTYFVYSDSDKEINNLIHKPGEIVEIPGSKVWIFVLDLELWNDFEEDLKKKWLKYLAKSI